MRTGFAADGTLLFQDVETFGLLGAYADIAVRVISKSTYLMCGPYRVPDARVHVRGLLSHTPPATAFRGFGTPQVAWAVESQMDEAARRLGIDRLEIRLRNLAGRGEEVVPGDKPADGDWQESVRKAADAIGWGDPLPPGRGRGIGVAIKSSATTGASYSIVRLHMDGSATVLAGTSDMGQGARTVLSQIAAEELGLPVEAVQIVMGDTGDGAVRPADVGQPVDGLHGHRGRRGLPRRQAPAGGDGGRRLRPARRGRRGRVRHRRAWGSAPCRSPSCSPPAFAGVRGEVIGVGSRRGEADPTTRSAVRRPSTSSTAPPSRSRSTGRPANCSS